MKELDFIDASDTTTELTLEKLGSIKSLEIEIEADFAPVLEEVKQQTGIEFESRGNGYHLTVIGPAENGILKTLTPEQVTELNIINKQIQSGEGIVVTGIGMIDGESNEFSLREVDKVKKTSFITLDIPALQEFRTKIGLPTRYFHVTLGFVGGDIHSEVTGQEPIKPNSPKMKDVTRMIPKTPKSEFSSIQIPALSFSELGGEEK